MLVSIVTPSIRLEKLKNCYKYLQNQVDKNFEWVVVTEKKNISIINFLKSIKDIQVKILINKYKIREKNTNYAVSKSSGRIISWLGDDDFLKKDSIKIVREIFIKTNTNWLVGYGSYVDDNYKPVRYWMTILKNFLLRNYHINTFKIINYFMTQSVFLKKSFFENYKGWDYKNVYCNDYECWLKLAKQSKPFILKKTLSSTTTSSLTETGKFNFQRYFKINEIQTKEIQIKYLPIQKLCILIIIIFNYLRNIYFGFYTLLTIKENKTLINYINKNKEKNTNIFHFTRFYQNTFGGIEKTIEQIILNSPSDAAHWVVSTRPNKNLFLKKKIGKKKYHVLFFKQSLYAKGIVLSLNLFKNYRTIYNNSCIIHFHIPWPLLDIVFLYNYFFNGLRSKKIVVSYHGYITKYKYLNVIYLKIQKILFARINFFHFSTKNYFLLIKNKIFLSTKKLLFFIPPNTLNNRLNKEPTFIIKKYIKEKSYLFIGRNRHYKNFETLAKLIKLNFDKNFLLITDYVNFKKDYDIKSSKVKILSNISENTKRFFLKKSYALIFTSNNLSESFGVVLVEAIRHKLPIIAFKSKAGHNFFLKDKYNSLLARKESVIYMNKQLNRLHSSNNLRDALSRNCEITYYKKFSDRERFNNMYKYILNFN